MKSWLDFHNLVWCFLVHISPELGGRLEPNLHGYNTGFFGPFWRPIFGRVPNAKKYVFYPIWIRKFPIQGTKKKTGEKITKYRHFTIFMFVVERAGPNSPNDTREITKYCKLPNGNVPLRQFSRIYLRRCRGVCNKHTWFILLVPYSGVLI